MSYGSQRAAAERAVAGLTGVRNIKDEIVVSWDADPVDVTALVQDALDRHALDGQRGQRSHRRYRRHRLMG